MSACKLIIDARERNVTRHAKEFENITYEIKQITTADYVVVTPNNNVLVAIERKSLEDYAASLKDGRTDNISKLIKMREETGCRIMYIIEGPPCPPPDAFFGNIAYKNIESSMFHLMIRDGVSCIQTRDTLDTAKTLARLVLSMDTLIKACIGARIEATKQVQPLANKPLDEVVAREQTQEELTTALTRTHTKPDHEIVREMWSCFRGIAVTTADDYSRKWSIGDIITKRTSRADIMNFKLSSGKSIGKNVINSLTGIDKRVEIKLLSSIPGISHSTAAELLSTESLSALLTYSPEALSIRKTGKLRRNLGEERATRILGLFWYKYDPAKTPTVLPVDQGNKSGNTTITDEELVKILKDLN